MLFIIILILVLVLACTAFNQKSNNIQYLPLRSGGKLDKDEKNKIHRIYNRPSETIDQAIAISKSYTQALEILDNPNTPYTHNLEKTKTQIVACIYPTISNYIESTIDVFTESEICSNLKDAIDKALELTKQSQASSSTSDTDGDKKPLQMQLSNSNNSAEDVNNTTQMQLSNSNNSAKDVNNTTQIELSVEEFLIQRLNEQYGTHRNIKKWIAQVPKFIAAYPNKSRAELDASQTERFNVLSQF